MINVTANVTGHVTANVTGRLAAQRSWETTS